MNGMQYMYPTFTLPASANTNQEKWDLATLSEREFIVKYKITPKVYNRLIAGESA